MANYTLEIPSPGLAPTEKYDVVFTEAELKKRLPKYASDFKKAAENSKVLSSILTCFSYAGNGLGQITTDYETRGVMGWNKDWVVSSLVAENNLKRLTPEEKDIFKKYNIKFSKKGLSRALTYDDQYNQELNITIGAILIGQLIDNMYYGVKDSKFTWNQSNGNLRLDKIYAMYAVCYKNRYKDYVLNNIINFIREDKSTNANEFLNNSSKISGPEMFYMIDVRLLLCKNGYMELATKLNL